MGLSSEAKGEFLGTRIGEEVGGDLGGVDTDRVAVVDETSHIHRGGARGSVVSVAGELIPEGIGRQAYLESGGWLGPSDGSGGLSGRG